MTVRAKFQCNEITEVSNGKRYKFSAVTDDGIPENTRFHKYTPSGSLEMFVDNPAVSFQVGQRYYLDLNQEELPDLTGQA